MAQPMVNLYKMRNELLQLKADFRVYLGDKRDRALLEESILEKEEEYKRLCILYNDYDEEDVAFHW